MLIKFTFTSVGVGGATWEACSDILDILEPPQRLHSRHRETKKENLYQGILIGFSYETKFFFCTASGAHSTSHLMDIGGSLPESKTGRRMNEWISISTLPMCLYGLHVSSLRHVGILRVIRTCSYLCRYVKMMCYKGEDQKLIKWQF